MRMFFLSLVCALATTVFSADDSLKAGGLTFQKPESFKAKALPPGGMRAAQLEYGAEGKIAEAVFFAFPGGAGGVQANVDRWLGQFEEPKDKLNSKVEKKKVGEKEITYVEAEGTYKSGMPGGPTTPKPGSKLLGAILEGPDGNIFVRMTGPTATVKAADADFRKMIESALK